MQVKKTFRKISGQNKSAIGNREQLIIPPLDRKEQFSHLPTKSIVNGREAGSPTWALRC